MLSLNKPQLTKESGEKMDEQGSGCRLFWYQEVQYTWKIHEYLIIGERLY